ncbi:hypothetical protein F5Y15DRAFT_210604 [Xylariaceae sp. FL0016]|nr:hypothetical protein F5Y15DRAFT_210604 [Xylariaceae sp. FL0016]
MVPTVWFLTINLTLSHGLGYFFSFAPKDRSPVRFLENALYLRLIATLAHCRYIPGGRCNLRANCPSSNSLDPCQYTFHESQHEGKSRTVFNRGIRRERRVKVGRWVYTPFGNPRFPSMP